MRLRSLYLFPLLYGLLWVTKTPDTPELLVMKNEYNRIAKAELVGTFHGKDTAMKHNLFLLSDSLDSPLLYFADIQTPVCIDNICKPMFIKIYWSLLGNYVGFDEIDGEPLTKYDHDLFAQEDKILFHNLLRDKHSILERRSLKALFDPNKKPEKQIEYKGQKVDGISGATKKEISESVVGGALFSCYTAWHLANGDVLNKIKSNFKNIDTPKLQNYFLHSGYSDYQYFAIRQMDSSDLSTSIERVSEIYASANSLTQSYILKKMPASVWREHEKSLYLFKLFVSSDINAKTLLIKKLAEAQPGSFQLLSGEVGSMTRNQLISYLDLLKDRPRALDVVLPALKIAAQQNDFTYAYLLNDFTNSN